MIVFDVAELKESSPRLTAHVKAGGCASKLSPKVLDRVLRALPRAVDPNVLVGFDTADDAGVYRLTDELALVQTVDFFTPVVDDPFTFGAIAAANALSDVYAMGGRPVTALSVVAWPADGDPEVLEAIMQGGLSKMREAGCSILGGHSVNDPEIKFGYAVTGLIHPGHVKPNAGARPGDALVLTKSLGAGVIATALKRGIARPESVEAAAASMLRLNREACEAMLRFDVHGCTDVTGFGLMGHAREMALASGVTIEIAWRSVPVLAGALEAIAAGAIPGGLLNNRDFVSCAVEVRGDIDPGVETLFYDPQTSGGLLIALAESDAEALLHALPFARRVGRAIPRDNKAVVLL